MDMIIDFGDLVINRLVDLSKSALVDFSFLVAAILIRLPECS